MNKTHRLDDHDTLTRWRRTHCGMVGSVTKYLTEFDTAEGNRFDALSQWSNGVTCLKCLIKKPKGNVV